MLFLTKVFYRYFWCKEIRDLHKNYEYNEREGVVHQKKKSERNKILKKLLNKKKYTYMSLKLHTHLAFLKYRQTISGKAINFACLCQIF